MATVTGMTEAAIKALVDETITTIDYNDTTGVLSYTKKSGEVVSVGSVSAKEEAVDLAYPVGSIYMSTVATNPAVLFGVGTWNRWGNGRVPVSLDTAQTEFDTSEKLGGTKTHALSAAELPAHTHTINHDHAAFSTSSSGAHDHELNRADAVGGSLISIPKGSGTEATSGEGIASDGAHTHTVDVPAFSGVSGSVGSGSAHNNLQPYITCYMWKRVG